MKIFKAEDYIEIENPNPGKPYKFRMKDYIIMSNPNHDSPYRLVILSHKHKAENLGGIFGLLIPDSQVPYHYHNKRESLIIILSGEGTEIIEGEEIPIKAGDILYIPAGEKHTMLNRSDQEFRYLEFFTCPPLTADFVEVK